MTNFISTQIGNWNDGATWGNASPGVKGTDWPGNAGDTATITNGHTVTYNVSETNEMGQIDVAGKLSFSDVASRKLTLGHQNLNISSGGELEIGTNGSNFDKTKTAEILWNTTSDNAKGLIITNGGKLTIYGASDYCSDYEDTLANDAENTDGDVRIKTVTGMSTVWNVGDEITIKIENTGDTTSHKDAVKKAVIQSFEAANVIVLDINITAVAGVGDTWISPVVNVTRNIQFGKLGADIACGDGSTHYNTNRPKFTDANVSGNNNCFFSYAMATGFYSIDSDYDFQFLNSTIRNGLYGFYYGIDHIISGNVYSVLRGFNGTGYTVSGNIYSNTEGFYAGVQNTISANIYSNSNGFYAGVGHIVSGNVYSNNYGFHLGTQHIVSANVYSNSNGFRYGTEYIVSGRVGYDSNDVSMPNINADFWTNGYNINTFLNVKLPLAGLNFKRNADRFISRIYCEHHDRTVNTHKIYDNNGDVVKIACDGTGDAPSVDPDGGNGDCIEISNIQSLCSSTNSLIAIEAEKYRIWAITGVQKTYTFKIQTTYAGISVDNLKLTVSYLDEGSGGHLAEAINAPAINQRADDTDWTQTLAVTITPSQTGWVSFEIKLMEYEAGKEVYIWPVVAIT